MKRILNRVISVIVILSSVLMLSCNKEISDNVEEHIALGLNKGALLYNNNAENGIKNLINGGYQNIDDKREIIQYSQNDTVLFIRDEKGIVEHNGSEIVLEDTRIIKENISPKGNYLMYFIEDETNALVLKLLNLETSKYEELNMPGTISGDLVDWYDNDTIIFYGVNNRKSGIFTYNFKTKAAKELYELTGSYLTYLESTHKGVIFKEEELSANEYVKIIDDIGKVNLLSSTIGDIIDLEVTDKGIYILGRQIKDDDISIFEYTDNEFQNVIFHFPSYVNFEKGISSTVEGDLLFIGSNTNKDEELVYKYADGSISSMPIKNSSYKFIKIK